ncbi:MAG: B12-binding domain-containing radical SAM protein [Candidatus Omnitrophica bacterium]|nr:B12-binding domain-containing radical SAM protein [Candidatus Omnitrophota bacterium]
MSKKVILFNPHTYHPSDRGIMALEARRGSAPLLLLPLAGPLLYAGFDVTIINQTDTRNWKALLLDSLTQNPLCIGINAIKEVQIPFALEVSRMVKANRNIPVIWSGINYITTPEQALANNAIDIVFTGDAENAFTELACALEQKTPLAAVKGICYRNNDRIERTSPADLVEMSKQPPPPIHLLKDHHPSELRFVTSKGCPYQCLFCHNETLYHHTWNGVSAEESLKTVRATCQRHQSTARIIRFQDRNFFSDPARAQAIAEGLIDIGLPWSASGRIDPFLDSSDAFLETLEKSRLQELVLGVESGSQRMLDLLKKNITVSDVIKVNQRLRRYSFDVTYLFLIGMPTETIDDINATLSLIATLLKDNARARKNINIYTPYLSNALSRLAIADGFQLPAKLEDWAQYNMKNTVGRPWLDAQRKQLIEMIVFCSIFMEKPRFPKNSPLHYLWYLYQPVALARIKNLYARFPVEIKLANLSGFSG